MTATSKDTQKTNETKREELGSSNKSSQNINQGQGGGSHFSDKDRQKGESQSDKKE